MKTSLIVIALTAFLLFSCERKKPSEANSAVENAAVSDARTDEDLLKTEIATGLEKSWNYWKIPVGDLEIMIGLSSRMGNYEIKRNLYTEDYYNFLQLLQEKGLAELGGPQQSEVSAKLQGETITVTVTPTEKAKKAADPNITLAGYVIIKINHCEVTQIIRSSPYHSPSLSKVEEYRLVLGTYRVVPTDFQRELYPDTKPVERKFRAVLQLNPFTRRYTFQFADWGHPEQDEWQTQNI